MINTRRFTLTDYLMKGSAGRHECMHFYSAASATANGRRVTMSCDSRVVLLDGMHVFVLLTYFSIASRMRSISAVRFTRTYRLATADCSNACVGG